MWCGFGIWYLPIVARATRCYWAVVGGYFQLPVSKGPTGRAQTSTGLTVSHGKTEGGSQAQAGLMSFQNSLGDSGSFHLPA